MPDPAVEPAVRIRALLPMGDLAFMHKECPQWWDLSEAPDLR